MRRLLYAAVAVALASCEAPLVHPTSDRRQNASSSRIEGELVATTRARGNAAIFLYDAARPPPPLGTGRPVSFAIVTRERLFASSDDGAGPFAAPFSFSLVPRGRYLLKGFIDREGCLPGGSCRPSDFIPWYGVTAEPNAGDVGGAAVDPLTKEARVVEIASGADGALSAAAGVTVVFTDAATLPDRPAFSVSPPSITLSAATGPAKLELSAMPIDGGVVHQGAPSFLVRFADEDGDGVPDDRDRDGVPELWPKVVLRKLAGPPNLLVDENDLDRNGVLDESGADYEHLDAAGKMLAPDGRPDLVVLAAGLDPTELLPLLDEGGRPKMTPVPVSKLEVVVKPVALDLSDAAAPARLAALPSGQYAVVLIQYTGQTWRVPNELAPPLASLLGLPSVESQGFTIQVP
ncbi:MAG: hypothetical protein HYZ28_05970 [Myxococcales bacterium]|nr:hypothetical protein [Myxococcales bacterium]